MSNKINLHVCLMFSVYKGFHQTVKYGSLRNHILQDLTWLEIKISIRPVKPKTGLKPVVNSRKPVYQKSEINIPNHNVRASYS